MCFPRAAVGQPFHRHSSRTASSMTCMNPGNAPALHSGVEDFSNYSDLAVELGGERVVIHHCQYAKYPVERAARALYEGLDISAPDGDWVEVLRDSLVEIDDDIEGALEDAGGLTVDLHDRSLFDKGQRINPMDVHTQTSRLVTLYSGFEAPEGEEHGYERYGRARRVPTNRAEFVADLLTLYHVHLARTHIDDLRLHVYDCEWTEEEAQIGLYALRDAIERIHGWSVFSAPEPSENLIEELWEMAEEVGFDPEVEWVYALFIVPHGAKYYEPNDSLDRSLRHSMGESMQAMMPGGGDPELKWAGNTPADEVEAHREQMRESRSTEDDQPGE